MNLPQLFAEIGCQGNGSGKCAFCSGDIPVRGFNIWDATLHTFPRCPARRLPDYLPKFMMDRLGGQIEAGEVFAPILFGDRTEHFLAGLGITKDKYVALKEEVGLMPNCWCEARKIWINKVHQWVIDNNPLSGDVV